MLNGTDANVSRLPPKLDQLDRAITEWMERYGHMLHRIALGGFFMWLGLLKQAGLKTTTSLLAHTVYWGTRRVKKLGRR